MSDPGQILEERSMEKAKLEIGELALLGTIGAFVVGFLLDIRGLPMEAKLLSYIAGPIALGLILFCAGKAFATGKKQETYYGSTVSQGTEDTLERREAALAEDRERRQGRLRMSLTGGMALFLLASIALIGFYFGSGLMLLIWFLCFKRINRSTLAITVLMPVLLYVCFETLLDMGLPKGALVEWLQQ
jgi:hypothetical protein